MHPLTHSTLTLRRCLAFSLLIVATSLYGSGVNADEPIGSKIDDDAIDALHPILKGRRDLFSGISISTSGEVVVHVHAGSQGEAKSLLKQTLKISHESTVQRPLAEERRSGGGKFDAVAETTRHRDLPQQHNIVLKQTRRSGADLDAVMDSITNEPEWEPLRAIASQWGIDLERNAVTVGVPSATSDLRTALNQKFGDAVQLYETQETHAFLSRLVDWQPWAGGIDIVTDFTTQCTASYVMERLDNRHVRGIVTAGHCVRAVGDAVYNTFGDDACAGSESCQNIIGHVAVREFGNNGHDVALITDSTYTPWTYTGDRFTTVGTAIKGSRLSTMGDSLCANGAATGETCGATVDAVNRCFTCVDPNTGSNKSICNASRITSSTGTRIADFGDSGGSVIKWTSGGVLIAGHMSCAAANPLPSGGYKSVIYVPVDAVFNSANFFPWRMSVTP